MSEHLCEATKKRIMTKEQAQREVNWWRKYRWARMSYYRCRKCKGYHIGNNRRKPLRKKW